MEPSTEAFLPSFHNLEQIIESNDTFQIPILNADITPITPKSGQLFHTLYKENEHYFAWGLSVMSVINALFILIIIVRNPVLIIRPIKNRIYESMVQRFRPRTGDIQLDHTMSSSFETSNPQRFMAVTNEGERFEVQLASGSNQRAGPSAANSSIIEDNTPL